MVFIFVETAGVDLWVYCITNNVCNGVHRYDSILYSCMALLTLSNSKSIKALRATSVESPRSVHPGRLLSRPLLASLAFGPLSCRQLLMWFHCFTESIPRQPTLHSCRAEIVHPSTYRVLKKWRGRRGKIPHRKKRICENIFFTYF